jgi:hypothetical protein
VYEYATVYLVKLEIKLYNISALHFCVDLYSPEAAPFWSTDLYEYAAFYVLWFEIEPYNGHSGERVVPA